MRNYPETAKRFPMVVDNQPTELRVIANWGDTIETRLAENE